MPQRPERAPGGARREDTLVGRPVGSTADEMDTDEVLTVPNAISAARLLLVPVFAVLIVTERDLAALEVH